VDIGHIVRYYNDNKEPEKFDARAFGGVRKSVIFKRIATEFPKLYPQGSIFIWKSSAKGYEVVGNTHENPEPVEAFKG